MSAFLNGDLDVRNFKWMSEPLGFRKVKVPDWLCFLPQSLYGLNNQHGNGTKSLTRFSSSLVQLIPSEADPCIYHNLTGPPVIHNIFVGDGANMFYEPGKDGSYSTGFGFSIQDYSRRSALLIGDSGDTGDSLGWKLLALLTEESLSPSNLLYTSCYQQVWSAGF